MLTRAYVGTSSVGASGLAMTAAKMYVKRVTVPAGVLLASVEAHLRTTDNTGVTLRPVLYEDNAGAPGKLIGYMGNDHQGAGTIEFNGRDDWVSLPLGKYFESSTPVWIGVMAPDIGTTALELSHETSGGDDQQINGFSATFVGEPGAIAGGSLTDPGSHLYSIRASLIAGWESHSRLGRSTIGGSWLAMTTAVYMKKITVPANSLIAGIAAHIKHTTANGSNLRAVLYSDNAGAPGLYLMNTPTGQGMFMSTTGRWLHFPIGKWNDVEQDYWIGIQMGGSNAFELAYDASGGGDGSKANHSDSGAWTAGDDDVSLYAEVLA